MNIWKEFTTEIDILRDARNCLDKQTAKTIALLASDLKQARLEPNQDIRNFKVYKVEEILLKINALFLKLGNDENLY